MSMERVHTEAKGYPADPFLLTVTRNGAPHCSPVQVQWAGDLLVVPAPRHWTQHEEGSHGTSPAQQVCLLYPPTGGDGYALVIDGTTVGTGPTLTVTVTRAVLHRRGHPSDDTTGSGCRSDCIPLVPEA